MVFMKRVGNRVTIRNWTNARSTMACLLIFSIVILYVIWTSSGNFGVAGHHQSRVGISAASKKGCHEK